MSKTITHENLLNFLTGPAGEDLHLLAFVAETEAFAGFCIGVTVNAYAEPQERDLQIFLADTDPDAETPHYRLKYQPEYELRDNGTDVKVTLVSEHLNDYETETDIFLVFTRAVQLPEGCAKVSTEPVWCCSCGKGVPAEYSGVHIESGTRDYFCAECAHILMRDREIYGVRRLTQDPPAGPEEGKASQ